MRQGTRGRDDLLGVLQPALRCLSTFRARAAFLQRRPYGLDAGPSLTTLAMTMTLQRTCSAMRATMKSMLRRIPLNKQQEETSIKD